MDVDRSLAELERASGLQAPTDGYRQAVRGLQDRPMVYHQVYSQGDQYGCGTYSPAWVERYLEKEYLRIDLVILGYYQRFHPIDWKRLDWSSKAACGFRAEAMEYWVGHQGFSIPMTGPNGQYAFFMASHHCSDEDWQTFKNEHSTS